MVKQIKAEEAASAAIMKNIAKAMSPMEQLSIIDGIRDEYLWNEIERRFQEMQETVDGIRISMGDYPEIDRKAEREMLSMIKNNYYQMKKMTRNAWRNFGKGKKY